jgi:two-component system OmpR family sensor kinase
MIDRLRLTTFRARLTLRWTLAVSVLLGVANLGVYAGASTYLHRWIDHNVRTLAATEAASSTDGLTDVHLHEGPFDRLESGAFTEKVVQIFDATGRLVLQSTSLRDATPFVETEFVRAALDGGTPLVSATVLGRPVRVAVLSADRDGRAYAVAVGLYADEVQQGLTLLAWLLGGVWVVSTAATAVIGYALASRALAPVARITERASWIAQGNFGARLDAPQVQDEVGRMTVLLNSMLDRLQAAVEANRRFAADASHELRGPLTAMAGELDVTLRHPRSAGQYEETLRHVRGRLSALIRLAEDLILLARAQEGSRGIIRREVDLAPLVDEAFGRMQGQALARGIGLSHDGLGGVRIYADPALIGRVVDNVIENAVHYNRDHGSVFVTAAVDEPDGDDWTTPMVRVQVADTGPGIPAEQRDRIFERFFRLDQSRTRRNGGSGLGLAICREVLGIHGGTIRVANSSTHGTTLEIRLPGTSTAVQHAVR